MRLLFICESFPTSNTIDITGGVEAGDWHIATLLAKRHQLTVITNARHRAPANQTMKGVKVIRVGHPVRPENRQQLFVRLAFIKACINQIPKLDFELIQGSNILTQAIAAYMGSKLKRPTIARIPDILIGHWIKNTNLVTGLIGEILEPWVIHQPWSKIISWSDSTQKKLINQGVDPSMIQVIPGGIDTSLIKNTQVDKRNTPTIITVARLVPYKHIEVLIEAVALISKSLPKLKLYILGDGPEARNLAKLVVKRNLDNKVIFVGFVDNYSKVIKLIKSSHLFCLPSKVEGFGLVTLEAVAAGIPYVNLDIPATREITDGGRGGILVDELNPKKFAQALESLLKDQKLYNTKVREGQSLIRKYDWSQCVSRTEKIFQKVIRQAKP